MAHQRSVAMVRVVSLALPVLVLGLVLQLSSVCAQATGADFMALAQQPAAGAPVQAPAAATAAGPRAPFPPRFYLDVTAGLDAIKKDGAFGLLAKHLNDVQSYLTNLTEPRITVFAPNDKAIWNFALGHLFEPKDNVKKMAKLHVVKGAYRFGRLIGFPTGAKFWTINEGNPIMKTSLPGLVPVKLVSLLNNAEVAIDRVIYQGNYVVVYAINALLRI